jgi:hypothetical protein
MPDNMTHTGPNGLAANVAPAVVPGAIAPAESPAAAGGAAGNGAVVGDDLGPNNERLEEVSPRLVNALRELVAQFRQEGSVARRHEIRRIRQARLFWQGLQYAWWNPQDMSWHLPSEGKSLEAALDPGSLESGPRYQFVTNLYQAFGLSFIAVISQDVPTTRFYPQSTLREEDISTAKAASEVAELLEQNNRVQQLLTGVGFYLWTDGKIGGYVRYVADGQRFGWRDELVLEERYVCLGSDAYLCPHCGAEHPTSEGPDAQGLKPQGDLTADVAAKAATPWQAATAGRETTPQPAVIPRSEATRNLSDASSEGFLAHPPSLRADGLGMTESGSRVGTADLRGSGLQPRQEEGNTSGALAPEAAPSFLAGTLCEKCGAPLGAADFRPAPLVPVPVSVSTRRVPNGQEVISIVGGLELNTPVWAGEQHEFPYLQWQMEVHSAKLRAAFPHAAEEIAAAGAIVPDDTDARAARMAVATAGGGPAAQSGDALFNLVTFSRTWIRPWAFYSIEDANVRDALLARFPGGCYVAFAGDTYCESRNESMDDCWRVMHALPGDGQNRPSVGDSLIQIQERYNTLSNIQAETYEYGIPPIYADPQVLDFDALAGQTAEPAAHYPARARPGMALADGFFQPLPAQVPPDMLRHQQDLAGPIAQFLTGLFPAVFGGEMPGVKTASGYAMARDQALGRLGLVWRRLKQFYADLMLLGVDCFRKNRPADVEIPFLGGGGEFQARFIRLADLRGNIQTQAEADETFPRLKSQQRAVLQQLMANPDPAVQATLREPANLGFIKSLIGLNELIVPGEESRNKQLREIQQLLAAAPIAVSASAVAQGAPTPARQAPRSDGVGGPEGFSSDDSQTTASGPLSSAAADARASQATAAADGEAAIRFLSTMPVDELLDDHATEFEECRRWASSDAGQLARAQNPAGFANVRAHAAEHARQSRFARGLSRTASAVPEE